jgi:transposase
VTGGGITVGRLTGSCGVSTMARSGIRSRSGYQPAKTCYDRFTRWDRTAPGHASRTMCRQRPTPAANSTGARRLHRRAGAPARRRHPRRGLSPAGQGMGRSRGGMTTKPHLLAEGRGRSLVKRLTPGQASDTKELVPLLDNVAVTRPGGHVRPRKQLDDLTPTRHTGRRRTGVRCGPGESRTPSAERDDVRSSRARKGSRGRRPPKYNAQRHKDHNRVERVFNRLKQFRAAATRYDKLKDRLEAKIAIVSIMIRLRAKPERSRP